MANLNNNYAGTATAGQIRGIVTTSGVNTIAGNTVRNLSTTSQNADFNGVQSVFGIIDTSPAAGQTVSQNTVHSLGNTAVSAAVSVTGIYYNNGGPTGSTNVVARNLVHSLAIPSSSTSARLYGMYFANGAFIAQNNMVRVGLKADGTSTSGASFVWGIVDVGTSAGRNFYHNSVYLGGTHTSGAGSTFAFQSTGSGNARTFQNNIFVNSRSNSGATSRHYAVWYTGASLTGLTAGGNVFLANGVGGPPGLGGVLGYANGDRTTLAAWQAATGQDTTSAVADPKFIAPTGTAATVDLHLQASNPAEGGGIALTDAITGAPVTVADDFDGQTRSTLTPADVGADAGNFTLSSDVFAPGISYPLLTSGSTANRVLTGWATITDNVGVATGASAPRLYFKKSTDADVFGGNTSADNGWKYVSATDSDPYSFTLDYTLIYNGGGGGGIVSRGDTIQYFVVAQDAANNLASSPAATASASPPVQNVNGHGGVNSFSIIGPPISGMKTVGSGGDYPSLSGAGGLFAALNGAMLTGNVVANITSDLTEDGGVALNEFNTDEHPSNSAYTLTIQPDGATMRSISGAAAAGLITLNGADRVTVDGRFGGSGRYLTFRNTNAGTSASTILFTNDASGNSVRNCIVEGASAGSLGVISFSTGMVTGNNNNLITGCQVRDLSTAAGVPLVLIGSIGSSAAVANSGNTIANNELFNFNNVGISIAPTGNGSWTLSGNDIFELNAATLDNFGILMRGGGVNVISGNSIHDMLTTSAASYGISFAGVSTTTIARNRITALDVNVAPTTVIGIQAAGSAGSTVNVVNNQITLSPSTSGTVTLRGIFDNGGNGSVVNVFCNSVVLGGTEAGTASSWASLRKIASTHTARDNLFLNLRTGGTGSHFAVGSEASGGTYTVSNNVYAGTGATAANFMDFSGTSGTSVPMSFATWQNATGDTPSQAGVAGSGSFTTAMFVNAAIGDLHLVPGGNVLVNALGTPIPGVTEDYDGELRSATTPSIGADEIPLADIAVTQTTALTDGVSSVNFGSVAVGGSSAAKTFTISNPGTADLTGLIVTGGTSEFVVSALSGTSVPVGNGSVTFTVTFTPGASGARSAAIHIASNVTGVKNPFDIALTGTGLTEQENWRLTYFGSPANSGIGADAQDADGDGKTNLWEFVAGLNPVDPASRFNVRIESVPDLGNPGQFIPGQQAIIFSPRFADRTYVVMSKASLSDPTWMPLGSITTSDNGTERTVIDLSAGTGPKFYLIEITKP